MVTRGSRVFETRKAKLFVAVICAAAFMVFTGAASAGTLAEAPGDVTKELVTIEYVNAPAFLVVDALCRQVGLNITMNQDSMGQIITMVHKETPLRQILDEMSLLLRKDWRIERNTLLFIDGHNPQWRSKSVEIPISRTLASEVHSNASAGLNSAGINAQLVLDVPRNTIIAIGRDDQVDLAADIVRKFDEETRQVAIDVTFLEVRLESQDGRGVKWSWDPVKFYEASYTRTDGDGKKQFATDDTDAFRFGVIARNLVNFEASLSAAVTGGDAKVLNSTTIMVRSGQSASLNSGEELPIVTRGENSETNTTFKQTGVQISVSPIVINDTEVHMMISPSVSEVTGYLNTQTTDAPITSNRNVSTTMSILDGQWLVISGLIQDRNITSDMGVPGLKEIPLVGNLFKTKTKIAQRTQTVVIIRPSIVSIQALTQEPYSVNMEGMEKSVGVHENSVSVIEPFVFPSKKDPGTPLPVGGTKIPDEADEGHEAAEDEEHYEAETPADDEWANFLSEVGITPEGDLIGEAPGDGPVGDIDAKTVADEPHDETVVPPSANEDVDASPMAGWYGGYGSILATRIQGSVVYSDETVEAERENQAAPASEHEAPEIFEEEDPPGAPAHSPEKIVGNGPADEAEELRLFLERIREEVRNMKGAEETEETEPSPEMHGEAEVISGDMVNYILTLESAVQGN